MRERERREGHLVRVQDREAERWRGGRKEGAKSPQTMSSILEQSLLVGR